MKTTNGVERTVHLFEGILGLHFSTQGGRRTNNSFVSSGDDLRSDR